jgi:hypothetical protein
MWSLLLARFLVQGLSCKLMPQEKHCLRQASLHDHRDRTAKV